MPLKKLCGKQIQLMWLCKDNPTSLQNMLKIIQFIWFGGIWVNENIHRWMRPLIPLWYWIFCVFEQATEKWNKIKYEYDQSGAPSHTIIVSLRKYWTNSHQTKWIELFWREVGLSLLCWRHCCGSRTFHVKPNQCLTQFTMLHSIHNLATFGNFWHVLAYFDLPI